MVIIDIITDTNFIHLYKCIQIVTTGVHDVICIKQREILPLA